MYRLAGVAFLVTVVAPPIASAQDARGILNFFGNQLQQEIQRQQFQEQQRAYQQYQQERIRQLGQLCEGGDINACDQALSEPGLLNQYGRQVFLQARAAVVERQQQAIREQEEQWRRAREEAARLQAEAERIRREEEQRRAERRQFQSLFDACRRYVVSSCDLALASGLAGDLERQNISAFRSTGQQFQTNCDTCRAGSVSACDPLRLRPQQLVRVIDCCSASGGRKHPLSSV